ncbi:putative monovalent cation/H+ antiporter subunit A [Oceaniglobus trochenteri]|uniref:putative monovalent cation/H+ antiporter subunit A n=1 Tax=Oceaniglobus trochenteri TaxID=2763260 RepID=UPI001CFFBFD7|nr:putative monovalent cation/H+ antiporter subunit A [Oceaniglobus trochenteri]
MSIDLEGDGARYLFQNPEDTKIATPDPDRPATNGPAGWLPVLLALALCGWFATFIGPVSRGEVLRVSFDWAPSLGISLSFLVDGLSLTFLLLISGIGALVLLYSDSYLRGHHQYGRFALYLTSFMLAMLGLVSADNLIALFVFWELTTITSYLLIGFDADKEKTGAKARRSALQALLVTGAGALALLAGLILMGEVAGSYEISQINAQGDVVRNSVLYLPIVVLVLAGAFTKSAQVPFHFWLPNAMAAPTPVSAFLHSATMVKAGVYLMARLHPSLSGTDFWLWTLTVAGAVTAVFASLQALRQSDLKQVLAYTTLMALGTLTLFLANTSGYAITAFVTFLVVHSLYKAALFLVVGCIDTATGTRDAALLGGLARSMPVTMLAAAVAAMSMAGFPPFLGFIGKELKYAGALAVASEPVLVAGAVLLANALMLAAAGVVSFKPFWRPAGGALPRTPKEAPWPMLAGPVILASLGALFGINPDLLQSSVVAPTVAALLGTPAEAKELALWAGVNLPLVLSLATFALGLLLYAFHTRLRALLQRVLGALPDFDARWDDVLNGLKVLAGWQTRLLQTGRLRMYMAVILFTFAAVIAATLALKGAVVIAPDFSGLAPKHLTVIGLIVIGSAIVTLTDSRMASIAALGTVGIGVAMVFILYSAPDVAITQLLVETLVVVLVAVAMLRMPHLGAPGERDIRPRDALLALFVGGGVTLTLLAVLATPMDLRLTEFFEETSGPLAHGRNIVNVILVDFRAIDTFGEIAVVVIAALSGYALLRTGKEAGR